MHFLDKKKKENLVEIKERKTNQSTKIEIDNIINYLIDKISL